MSEITEKWIMGLLAAVIVVFFGWWLNSITAQFNKFSDKIDVVSDRQATIQSSQAGMQKDISWIKIGVNDIYTKSEAKKKHAEIYRTDQDQYSRINALDKRVRVLESEARK
ncbi:MAG: hypothetical protein PF501_19025 [Salinisphaera sp.]|jgi:formiminotetrahydrofolate cyclodeaminase|nr:hypothetical protein [Salinisphaera sp.]